MSKLLKKKEEIMVPTAAGHKSKPNDDDLEVDEQDFEELLDWRSKKAWH